MKTPFSSIHRRPSIAGRRRGFSMLELQVSFAAFGVILAGLCPIMVAELRHVTKLESRFTATNADLSGFTAPTVSSSTVNYYYIGARPEPWTRKLAGTASITEGSAGATTTPSGTFYTVTLSTTVLHPLEQTPGGAPIDDWTATVTVTR